MGQVFDVLSWVRSEAQIWGSFVENRGALGICSAAEPCRERNPSQGRVLSQQTGGTGRVRLLSGGPGRPFSFWITS